MIKKSRFSRVLDSIEVVENRLPYPATLFLMMAGLVAIISLMIPYTVVFMLAWAIMITIWMLLGIPVGIEGPIHMPAM